MKISLFISTGDKEEKKEERRKKREGEDCLLFTPPEKTSCYNFQDAQNFSSRKSSGFKTFRYFSSFFSLPSSSFLSIFPLLSRKRKIAINHSNTLSLATRMGRNKEKGTMYQEANQLFWIITYFYSLFLLQIIITLLLINSNLNIAIFSFLSFLVSLPNGKNHQRKIFANQNVI